MSYWIKTTFLVENYFLLIYFLLDLKFILENSWIYRNFSTLILFPFVRANITNVQYLVDRPEFKYTFVKALETLLSTSLYIIKERFFIVKQEFLAVEVGHGVK